MKGEKRNEEEDEDNVRKEGRVFERQWVGGENWKVQDLKRERKKELSRRWKEKGRRNKERKGESCVFLRKWVSNKVGVACAELPMRSSKSLPVAFPKWNEYIFVRPFLVKV